MPVAYASSSGASLPTAGGGTLSITKPSGVAAGDLLLAFVILGNGAALTPNAGDSWNTTVNAAGVKGYWKIAGSSEPASYTFARGNTLAGISGTIVRLTGAHPTAPIDTASAQTGGTDSTVIIPSLTPAASGRFLFQIAQTLAATSFTPPGTATERFDAQYATATTTSAGGDETIGSGATGTRTWSAGASSARSGIMWAIIPAPPNAGTATGAHEWSGTATGSRESEGTASGAHEWGGSADGTAEHQGDASGAHEWDGAASGSRDSEGSATGGHEWSGTATGSHPPPEGSATGSHEWSGTAAGTAPRSGSATGAHEWDGSASGSSPNRGEASGSHEWDGTAAGSAEYEGSAVGSHEWDGTASGTADYEGTASGGHEWNGSAQGSSPHGGEASGGHEWSGSAVGTNTIPVPSRNPRATIKANRANGGIRANRARASIQP